MKSLQALSAALLLAQPALATRLVQIEAAPAACSAGAPDCAAAAEPAASGDGGIRADHVVAGLAGILVLGLVFGRRRPSLPQVVS